MITAELFSIYLILLTFSKNIKHWTTAFEKPVLNKISVFNMYNR